MASMQARFVALAAKGRSQLCTKGPSPSLQHKRKPAPDASRPSTYKITDGSTARGGQPAQRRRHSVDRYVCCGCIPAASRGLDAGLTQCLSSTSQRSDADASSCGPRRLAPCSRRDGRFECRQLLEHAPRLRNRESCRILCGSTMPGRPCLRMLCQARVGPLVQEQETQPQRSSPLLWSACQLAQQACPVYV
jgi:hypothetical protein